MAKISMALRYKLLKHLETVLERKEGGRCQYTDGQSDKLVAELFGISTPTVSGTRQEVFGVLIRQMPMPVGYEAEFARLHARLDAIEVRAKEQQEVLAILVERLNREPAKKEAETNSRPFDLGEAKEKLASLGRVTVRS